MNKNNHLHLFLFVAFFSFLNSSLVMGKEITGIKLKAQIRVDRSSGAQSLVDMQASDYFEFFTKQELPKDPLITFVLLDKNENMLEIIGPKYIECCSGGDPKDKDKYSRPAELENSSSNLEAILKCKCELTAKEVFQNSSKASLVKIKWKEKTIDRTKSILPILWRSMKQPSDPELAIFPSGKPDYAFAMKNIKESIHRLEQSAVDNKQRSIDSMKFMLKRFEVEARK